MVMPMVMRIEPFLVDERYASVFGGDPATATIGDEVNQFMNSAEERVLRVDVSSLPSERHFKQVVVNALTPTVA